jgi:large subunit ribosomal protein L17
MLKNMAIALITSERMETTVPKAKTIRSYIEKLITKSRLPEDATKEQTMNAYRNAFTYLQDKKAVSKLMTEIAPKYVGVNGGYTRIIKTRQRRGDAAPMALIELV